LRPVSPLSSACCCGLIEIIQSTDHEQRLEQFEKRLGNPDKDVASNKRENDLDRDKIVPSSISSESG
jgi:hypothetical protein